MTALEQGFLLLTSTLGNPARKPLTIPQLRNLAQRMQAIPKPQENRDLLLQDLIALGYDNAFAQRVLDLLSDTVFLNQYITQAQKQDCYPITRASFPYPAILKKKLGWDAPGVLWVKGDCSILDLPAISLVGSRDLLPANEAFAKEVGKQAALQGFVLISGNARGADRVAQESCLEYDGKVISIVADSLQKQPLQRRVLYLSEESFAAAFTPQRALQRNRIIHALGQCVFVAQSSFRKGGTWDGTTLNLRKSFSPVYCFADSSPAVGAFCEQGAHPIDPEQLQNLSFIKEKTDC